MEPLETSSEAETAPSAMKVASEAFAKARLEAGLTQDQVADALKITRERVIRLEGGDVSELPSPIYVKGYVREFERILGLERQSIERPFVKALEQHAQAVSTNSSPPVRDTIYTSPGQRLAIFLRAHPGRVLTAILLAALAGIAFSAWWVFLS